MAVDEGLYEWGDFIKSPRGICRYLFSEPDETSEVRACVRDVVGSVWPHVGDRVDGEIGDEGVCPYWIPVHCLGPVKSTWEDANSKSVVGPMVVAKGVVVVARG